MNNNLKSSKMTGAEILQQLYNAENSNGLETVIELLQQLFDALREEEAWDSNTDSVLSSTTFGTLNVFYQWLNGYNIDLRTRQYLSHRSGMDRVETIINSHMSNNNTLEQWRSYMYVDHLLEDE